MWFLWNSSDTAPAPLQKGLWDEQQLNIWLCRGRDSIHAWKENFSSSRMVILKATNKTKTFRGAAWLQRAKAGDGWVKWRPQQEGCPIQNSSSNYQRTCKGAAILLRAICSTYILARVHNDTCTEVFTKALSATTKTTGNNHPKLVEHVYCRIIL